MVYARKRLQALSANFSIATMGSRGAFPIPFTLLSMVEQLAGKEHTEK
jgi:hypothetical protein